MVKNVREQKHPIAKKQSIMVGYFEKTYKLYQALMVFKYLNTEFVYLYIIVFSEVLF